MSCEILSRLGTKSNYSSTYSETDSYDNTEYIFDDLKIVHDKEFKIYYCNKVVMDSSKFISGIWEELLLDIYDSIDALEYEKIHHDTKMEIGKKFFIDNELKYMFPKMPISYKKLPKSHLLKEMKIPGIDIVLIAKLTYSDKDNGTGYDEYIINEIYKDNICVFKSTCKNYIYQDIIIDVFIPGLWQDELLNYFHCLESEKENNPRVNLDEPINDGSITLRKKRNI